MTEVLDDAADEELPADMPTDPAQAFAYLVSKCAQGLATELMQEGKTELQARNRIIHAFIDMAAGEACRIARREGREPNHEKWTSAVDDAFARAVKRTAPVAASGEISAT